LTNQILLEKLGEMDIAVKSHMSSLDEDTIARVRSQLFGKKAEAVEETRVKPTVIRRRKKAVTVEVPPEIEPEVEAAPETAAPEAEAPAAEAPEEAAVEIETGDEAAAAPQAVEPAADEVTEPSAKEAQAEEPVAEEIEQSEAKPEVKAKKVAKKANKKDAAAKIIKAAPTQPLVKPKREDEKRAARPAKRAPARALPGDRPPPVADAPGKDTKKRKKKRKTDEAEGDRKFLKKKYSPRKKTVIEGSDLYDSRHRSRKGRKLGKAQKAASGQKTQITVAKAIKRRIKIDEAILLSDLAKRMGIKANELIASLMSLDVMATVNQALDFETAALVAAEFDYEVERATFEEEPLLKQEQDDPEKLSERAPVVTIMGHVDHGKTSLLDVIRETKITELEAGGITQHIGAYHVETDKGQIAFLDTPGHEAFTAMRARGAQVTDIVVLVVAADDGVMPQTLEAINHARAAEVPIIVAVNKIDKANAEPDRVKRELSENGLTPEDWGGDTICVNVSAKLNEGIDELLEMILLQAEVLELKANPDKLAVGHVVEAKIDSGRGAVATVLVRDGTLRAGDPVVCGVHSGKIRAMLGDRGNPVETAGPSIPVEILGLSGVPMAGDEFIALADEKSAKQVSMHRMQKHRTQELAQTSRLSLDKLYEQLQQGDIKDLNLVIRADVHGSIEALVDALTKLSNDEVNVNAIQAATGTITETDISLATVSNAIIIGFNVRPTPKVQALANDEQIDMRFYNVIYDVIKDVKDAMVGMMESTYEERSLGSAEVREVFHIPKVGAIAGCYVTDGKIERGQLMRVVRDGFNDIKTGDVLECYYLEEIRPEIE
jgi:translation initiation factor IF-2